MAQQEDEKIAHYAVQYVGVCRDVECLISRASRYREALQAADELLNDLARGVDRAAKRPNDVSPNAIIELPSIDEVNATAAELLGKTGKRAALKRRLERLGFPFGDDEGDMA